MRVAQALGALLLALSLASGLFFALFPWCILWNLNMQRRDKIVIASSMSLGLLASVCAVMRTRITSIVTTDEFIYKRFPRALLGISEAAVELVCVTVPVCRPLYARYIDKLWARTVPDYRWQRASIQPPLALRTIGGTSRPGQPRDDPERGKLSLPVPPGWELAARSSSRDLSATQKPLTISRAMKKG
ncbi:hypothetical protein B0T22DRAFT_459023 [Podospora appendiculata]|uniref:Rhodopsin domain-containing protein n=1 Tax=Podospora appendiculata TaxID=314037 RepID=A0AAE0X9N0_9PEZI|nr:hypothetical protein B0T22DRAFT_459023 [Podospora appendiculata]